MFADVPVDLNCNSMVDRVCFSCLHSTGCHEGLVKNKEDFLAGVQRQLQGADSMTKTDVIVCFALQ